jgi:hypothetical protein
MNHFQALFVVTFDVEIFLSDYTWVILGELGANIMNWNRG